MGTSDQPCGNMLAGADIRPHPVPRRDASDGRDDELCMLANWVCGVVRHTLLVCQRQESVHIAEGEATQGAGFYVKLAWQAWGFLKTGDRGLSQGIPRSSRRRTSPDAGRSHSAFLGKPW